MPLVGDRVRLAPLALTAPFAALFVAASSMPPPMHPRPRAARPTLPRRAPDLFTLSTPLVATLTAAAAGRPPSLAATVIAPQSCRVAAMSAQCGSAVSTLQIYTPFLERRILQVGVFGGSGEHTV